MSAVDVLTFGESMGSLRTRSPLRLGGAMELHLAGAESNVAIGLARLGHSSRWAGRVRDDEIGEFVLRQLRAEGVAVDGVPRDATRATGLMFLEQRTADVSRAHYYRAGSAGSALAAADLEAALAAGARVLHLTGITPALSDSAREATVWAARTAADAGIVVSLDANYRSKLWSRGAARAVLAPLAAAAQMVIASDDELDLLDPRPAGGRSEARECEVRESEVIGRLLEAGVAEVVIKRGARGAGAYTGADEFFEGPIPVSSLDTIGAGDAFCAGYLSAFLDGHGVGSRLRRGAVLGAFAVSTAGDWEGLPNRAELALLEQQESGTTVR